MFTLAFWSGWSRSSRALLFAFLAITIVALIGLWMSWLQNPAPAIQWQNYQQLEVKPVTLSNIESGLAQIPVEARNLILFERFLPSLLHVEPIYSYAFLVLLTIGFIAMLSVISTFNRFWFFASMGLFIVTAVSLSLESLLLWSMANKVVPIVFISSVCLLGFWFQFFAQTAGLVTRLFSFAMIFLILGIVIGIGAQVPTPFLLLAAQSSLAGMVITTMLICIVAMEIPAAFVTAITRSTRGQNNLRHFLVISAIYLINLTLVYLDHKQIMEWSFVPLNYYLLFSISAILGFWGYHSREPQYEHIFSAEPFGMVWYLALTIISFSTLPFFLFSANDTVLIVVQDMTLYSHLGFGVVFVMYVLANFVNIMGRNLPVHRILYKPDTMPYFSFRMAGAIATFAFFAYSGWRGSLGEYMAGYYNAIADVYYRQEDREVAEGYYQRSLVQSLNNHHARYALASLYQDNLEISKAKAQLEELTDIMPTEEACARLAYLYERNDDVLESVLTLRKGLQKNPGSGILRNALALALQRIQDRDSALYYFEQARQDSRVREQASVNLISAGIQFRLAFPADSLLGLLQSQSEGLKANAVALANQQGVNLELPFDLGRDTTITVYEAAFLNNLLYNQLGKTDTIIIAAIEQLAQRPSNEYFKNELLAACATAYYQAGWIKRGFDLMRQVAFVSGDATYQLTLGGWAMEQGSAAMAAELYKKAEDRGSKEAYLYRALALTEAQNPEALLLWDSLQSNRDTVIQKFAKQYLNALIIRDQEIANAPQEVIYLYCLYRIDVNEQSAFNNTAAKLTSFWQSKAKINRAKQLLSYDMPQEALALLESGLNPTPNEVEFLLMKIAARADDRDYLKSQLTSNQWQGYRQNEVRLYEGLAENKSERIITAGRANMFDEEAAVAAAHELEKSEATRLDAYSLLVDALLYKPESVYLLKAYALTAARIGFDRESEEALEKLKSLLPGKAFNQFVLEHPQIFSVE